VKAYFYFPLAIAKESSVGDAVVTVRVKPMGGKIDQAGRLVFGLRNVGNYFVLRINAIENNLILFEFVNNRRFSRAAVSIDVETDHWYEIQVDTTGNRIQGYLDGESFIEYSTYAATMGEPGGINILVSGSLTTVKALLVFYPPDLSPTADFMHTHMIKPTIEQRTPWPPISRTSSTSSSNWECSKRLPARGSSFWALGANPWQIIPSVWPSSATPWLV
jgi:hypothetical protein